MVASGCLVAFLLLGPALAASGRAPCGAPLFRFPGIRKQQSYSLGAGELLVPPRWSASAPPLRPASLPFLRPQDVFQRRGEQQHQAGMGSGQKCAERCWLPGETCDARSATTSMRFNAH